jgi:8-oxo-dGTP pyrophosphatase MutT (NUDIX family)
MVLADPDMRPSRGNRRNREYMTDELTPENPPPAIPAATVVLVRDGDDGVEVLMLHRNPRIGFGGMWVFPGGRIELSDGELGDRTRMAAAREVLEETGITVDPVRFVPYAHWSPPPATAKRFDTTFFVAEAPGGEVEIDGDEIHDHAWARPTDFLDRHAAGEVALVPPTWVTLHRLVPFATVSEVLADARGRAVETFVTHLAQAEDQLVALWHGDAAYDGSPLDTPGGRHRLYLVEGAWRYERT